MLETTKLQRSKFGDRKHEKNFWLLSKILFVALERLTHRRVWSLAVFYKDTGVRTVLKTHLGSVEQTHML